MFRFERQEMMEDSGLMTFQTSSLQEPSPKFRPFLDRLVRSVFFIFFFHLVMQISSKEICKHGTGKRGLNLKLKRNSQMMLEFPVGCAICSQALS